MGLLVGSSCKRQMVMLHVLLAAQCARAGSTPCPQGPQAAGLGDPAAEHVSTSASPPQQPGTAEASDAAEGSTGLCKAREMLGAAFAIWPQPVSFG